MPWPDIASPFGGMLAAFTCSVFRVDPITGIPFEPLPDIVPGYSPLRVTLDCVDGDTATYEYETTEHAIQGLVDITTNVRKRLEQITINGTLSGAPPLLPFGLTIPSPPLPTFPAGIPPISSLMRQDMTRFAHLKAMADMRQPVMVITPRGSLPKAIITSLSRSWSPDDGESTMVSATFRQARIVSPLTGNISIDYPSQSTGNNANGGSPSQANVGASASSSGETFGAPPP